MNRNNAISQSSLLHEMVRIKKIRFKDEQKRRLVPKPNQDAVQRKANFEEFKSVYEESMQRFDASLERESQQVHQTRSGSLCRFSRAKKEPQHVETINIELPIHYGADRAVQLIENKIKPKRASRTPKVNREVITESLKSSLRPSKSSPTAAEARKSVTIAEQLRTIEEISQVAIADTDESPIQNEPRGRKDKVHKTISRHSNVSKPMRKKANTKIMNALSDINEKLQQMQEKYFNTPKVQYKNVHDCFTQIGNVEILYENQGYPDNININDVVAKYNLKNISQNVLSDSKMQERIREMNEMFPEFPKIEDTLKEIETHLDNIVNLETVNSQKIDHRPGGDDSNQPSKTLEREYPVQESMTNEILQMCEEVKDQKRKTMRYQIEEVEEFCEKLSEIANEESIDLQSVCSRKEHHSKPNSTKPGSGSSKKAPTVSDFVEGSDLQCSIKKSSYLSRELRDIKQEPANPMVKIFSENKLSFWREKVKQMRKENELCSAENASRLFNTLKFSLEDSVYEPVT